MAISCDIAHLSDASEIVALLNTAYRGDASREGWTTEAHLIEGEVRSNIPEVLSVVLSDASDFVLYRNTGVLQGCVAVTCDARGVYVGMFAVQPALQNKGIGRMLLERCEAYARSKGLGVLYMTVIAQRTELIAWYVRRGYVDTGERRFFEEDGFSGRHVVPLRFVVLQKTLDKVGGVL
jgi:N-acetylglutamate synthase-like GNAT family acetyltransferase